MTARARPGRSGRDRPRGPTTAVTSPLRSGRPLASGLAARFRRRWSSVVDLGLWSMAVTIVSPSRANVIGTTCGRPPGRTVASRATGARATSSRSRGSTSSLRSVDALDATVVASGTVEPANSRQLESAPWTWASASRTPSPTRPDPTCWSGRAGPSGPDSRRWPASAPCRIRGSRSSREVGSHWDWPRAVGRPTTTSRDATTARAANTSTRCSGTCTRPGTDRR